KDKSIADVLKMTVEEGYYFFENLPKIKRKIKTLVDVGLGYVRLGQPATTLSGGEAQRVKLASELHRRSNGKTLYILDEPTTGLHSEDIKNLIGVIQRLVDQGDTVVIIEHNLDVIKVADHIIDLGPEGGEGGGNIVVSGTVEDVTANENSHTGHHLKKWLTRNHKEEISVERKERIIKMLEEGKITSEEAIELMSALNAKSAPENKETDQQADRESSRNPESGGLFGDYVGQFVDEFNKYVNKDKVNDTYTNVKSKLGSGRQTKQLFDGLEKAFDSVGSSFD